MAPKTAKLRAVRRTHKKTNPHSIDDRTRRIAEAAYLRAEKRGFVPGCELDDWLAAEAEIDAEVEGK